MNIMVTEPAVQVKQVTEPEVTTIQVTHVIPVIIVIDPEDGT